MAENLQTSQVIAKIFGVSTNIRWLKPVFAGDVLTGKVTITNLVKRNEKKRYGRSHRRCL